MDRRQRNCIGCAICAQPESLCTNISHDTAYTKIEKHRIEQLVQENESMRKQMELLRFVLRKHDPTYHNVHEIYFESCEGSVDECQSSHRPIKVEVNQETKTPFVRVHEIHVEQKKPLENVSEKSPRNQKHRVRGRRSPRKLNIKSADRQWNMEYSSAAQSIREPLRQKVKFDAHNDRCLPLQDNLRKSKPTHRKINVIVLPDADDTQPSSAKRVIDKKKFVRVQEIDKVLADTDHAQLSSANSVSDEKEYVRVHEIGLGAQALDREHTDFLSIHSERESMKSDVVESPIQKQTDHEIPIENRERTESKDISQDMQRTGVDCLDSGIFDNLWDCSSLGSWRTLRFKHRYTAALADKYFPRYESHDSNKSLISKTMITGKVTTPQNQCLNFQDWLHGVTNDQTDVQIQQHMDHPPEYFRPDIETVIVFE